MSGLDYEIVAFTTNESFLSPNEIIKIFFNFHPHDIKAETSNTISCIVSPINHPSSLNIMMCSLPDLKRTYEGLCDVSFYFLFVDLQKEDAQNAFDKIWSYMLKNCDLNKKIYTFGVIRNKLDLKNIKKENIIKELEGKVKYKYFEICMEDRKNIGDIFLNIFLPISPNVKKDKELKFEPKIKKGPKKQIYSCILF